MQQHPDASKEKDTAVCLESIPPEKHAQAKQVSAFLIKKQAFLEKWESHLSEFIAKLREGFVIESDVAIRFKYEKLIAEADGKRKHLEQKLAAIEADLKNFPTSFEKYTLPLSDPDDIETALGSIAPGTVFETILHQISPLLGKEKLGEKIDSVEEKVQLLLNQSKETLQKILEIPFLAPPRPSHEIVGRKDMIERLKEKLFAGENLGLSALNGMPGVGKTALAVELAYDPAVIKHFSDGILWAPLGQNPDPFRILGDWLFALGMHGDVLKNFQTTTERRAAVQRYMGDKKILAVIDDVWDMKDALEFKIGAPNAVQVITTRQPQIALDFAGQGQTLVPELSEADGLILLRQHAPQAVALDQTNAVKLVKAVGSLPLALNLMGRFLKKEGYTDDPGRIKDALQRLQDAEERIRLEGARDSLKQHPGLPEGAFISVQAVIYVSYDALADSEKHCLRALSVFPAKPVTFSKEAAVAVSGESPTSLYRLSDAGLVEGSGGRYTLHQTIADYGSLKRKEDAAEENDSFERYASYFTEFLTQREEKLDKGNPHDTLDEIETEIEHIKNAWQYAEEKKAWEYIAKSLEALCKFCALRGWYQEGAAIFASLVEALPKNEKLNEEKEKLLLGRLLDSVGQFTFYLGKLTQAEEHIKKSLEIWGKNIGKKHPDYASPLNNLAMVYAKLGKYPQAEKFQQKSLEISKKNRGEEHPEYANSLNNLAVVYYHQGKFPQAEDFYKKSLDIWKKILGEEHPDYAQSLNNLAGVYVKQKKYSQAEELYKKSLEIKKKTIGEEHPNYAISLGYLGALYYDQKRYEAAVTHQKAALTIFEKSLGSDHPRTIKSREWLAVARQALEKESSANRSNEK